MSKKLHVLAICTFLISNISTVVNAAVFTDTLPEVSFDGNAPFPSTEQTVGTFSFLIPDTEVITSAVVSGTFGNNAFIFSTAGFDLFGDGIFLGQCIEFDDCWSDAGIPLLPFEFILTDLSVLSDGELTLSFIQTSEFIVRLGSTTLTIETRTVPLPATAPLFAAGLAGIGLVGRRKKLNH